MRAALALRGVVKRYGRIAALDGASFSVPRGSICGLVGCNGAGKTTAFGCIGGYLRIQAGRVDLLGEGPFDPRRHAGRVTLLPQDAEPPRYARAGDLLRYYGRLQGLSREDAVRSAAEVLAWVHLADRAEAPVRTLSHGMRRRLLMAQAFLGAPELVLLDEPLSGLDPREVVRVRGHIAARRGRQTIVVSSHNLHEIERICDQVVFLDAGRTVRAGSLESMTERRRCVRVRFTGGPAPLEALAAALPGLQFEPEGEGLLVARYAESAGEPDRLTAGVLRVLLDAGRGITAVEPGMALEEAYLRGGHAGPP